MPPEQDVPVPQAAVPAIVPAAAPHASRAAALLAVLAAVCLTAARPGAAPAPAYHDEQALAGALQALAAHPRATLSQLGTSAGERPLWLLRVAPADADASKAGDPVAPAPPAVLVIADPLGTTPLATEAALALARRLLAVEAAAPGARADAVEWLIVPRLNPDAAARYFARPRRLSGANDQPVDDDRDGLVDEDGPDDLDGDGLITTLLRPHPAGAWLLAGDRPPRLARPADPARGERGLYHRHVEGRDDDGDGAYNEDGPGGVTPGRNFPHGFEHWTAAGGIHPASEPESRALLRLASDTPGIALVLVLGETNSLTCVPPGGRVVPAGREIYRVPAAHARRWGLDPALEYDLEALTALMRRAAGKPALTADEVLVMLSLGPAVNPDRDDLPWWQAMALACQDSLRAVGLANPRVAAAPPPPGAVEDWAYYQLGVPAFAYDLWSAPLPPAAAAADSAGPGAESGGAGDDPRDGASGGEAVSPGLRPNGAGGVSPSPAPPPPAVDPGEQALAELALSRPSWGAYVEWRTVTLEGVGEVLVGGPAPFALRTPPPAAIDSLLAPQLPMLLALPDWLPRLEIAAIELEDRGAGVWAVTAHLRNPGRLPYPTAHGARTQRIPPVSVQLEGGEVLEGRARCTVAALPAGGGAEVRWLVRGRAGSQITVRAAAPALGSADRGFRLDAEGGWR